MPLTHVGQVALVRTRGILPWLIRFFTRGANGRPARFNHMVVGIQGGDTVSAEHRNVRIRHQTHFKLIVWSQFTETELQHWEVADFAYQQIGKPYNWWADFWILISILTRRHTPRWVEERLNDGTHWQCAQLAYASLMAAHPAVEVLKDARPPATRFPGAFEKLWMERGWLT